MLKSLIIRQLNEISNSKVASSSLLRLQKTASSLDSRFAERPHTQIVPTLTRSEPIVLSVSDDEERVQSPLKVFKDTHYR